MSVVDMCQLTVAICTYNGAKRLSQVLDCLRSQVYPSTLRWEVIVVDNNSSDHTAEVVRTHQLSWPENIPLRYGFEPKQGLALARQRAVEMAMADWVGFLDDDNLPDTNWVAAAHDFSQQHPQAGVFGSRILAEYEVEPPMHFERISRFLAINPSTKLICYSDQAYRSRHKQVYPPGAGAVINRAAWLKSVPEQLTLQGRVSGLCLPGEDVEAFTYLRKAGWEIWSNPAMTIKHLIPRERLQKIYLHNLLWRTGLSRHRTRQLAYASWQYALMIFPYGINDGLKLFRHCCQYSLWPKNMVLAGERRLLLGSLLSPIYFLIKAIKTFLKRQCENLESIVSPSTKQNGADC
jgi:glycosyltransferase involved in cell wall biosynthesis